MKKVDFILTADWHLREDTPICRTDNFWQTQWKKVDFIAELAEKYKCPVLHSGDLFHHWKPSPYLLSMCVEHLPKTFWTVYGNHDLPQHNLQLAYKSGIYVLEKANRIKVLKGTHWEQEPLEASFGKILVWHIMTYKNELPYPGCEELPGRALLKKYPQYDLIVTGDNHQTFVEEFRGRLLVNPGSIMRQQASQLNFQPSVFLYNLKDNKVQQVFIPIEDVISREHIEIQEKRNNRIDAFISGLNTDFENDISFQKNLEKFIRKNKIKKEVNSLIYKALEL
jgi:DNA repair exonuclease SbcCD nuclease subunit